MRLRRFPIFLLPMLLSASETFAAYRGETYTCHYGRHGTVIIDTREPGGSITVRGKRYPAQGGSDFYQTDDGKIAVLFGPNMRFWDYEDVRDDHCVRRRNKR